MTRGSTCFRLLHLGNMYPLRASILVASVFHVLLSGCGRNADRSAGLEAGATDADSDASESAVDASLDGSGDVATVVVGGTFLNEIFPIVSAHCLVPGCHDIGIEQNHFAYYGTPESTYMNWVNHPADDYCDQSGGPLSTRKVVVVPSSPVQSLLLAKLTSTRTEFCALHHWPRMPPLTYPPLAAQEIELIRAWIADGAKPSG